MSALSTEEKLRPSPPSKRGAFPFFKQLFPYLKQNVTLTLTLLSALFLEIICVTLIPLFIRTIFDDALANKNMHQLIILLSILVLIALIITATIIIFNIACAKLSVKITECMRIDMFDAIQSLSNKQLKKIGLSNLVVRFSSDLAAVYTALIQAFWNLVYNFIMCLSMIVLLYYLNWPLATLVMIGSGLLSGLALFIGKYPSVNGPIKKRYEYQIADFVKESVEQSFAIKSLNLTNTYATSFKTLLGSATSVENRYYLWILITKAVLVCGVNFLRVAIIAVGSYWVYSGHLSLGEFIAFFSVYVTFAICILSISDAYPAIAQTSHSLTRITDLINMKAESKQQNALPDLPVFSNNIAFENVYFDYSERTELLQNISFEIMKGDMIAFVGQSGSGKSTLLDLLLQQEIPTQGKICFDNRDLHDYSADSFLKQISVVPQTTALFTMSIFDNIHMGKLDATPEAVIAAAQSAEIHNEISGLPQGYHTLLGENEALLSSGQAQRILLARALLRQPAILILDETTASLDIANETAIMETLLNQAKQRTTIMVTHNLKEAQHMNKIFVLNKGHITESGTHHELLEKLGDYYHLWIKQSGITFTRDGSEAQIDTQWLKRIPLFSTLSAAVLEQIAKHFVIVQMNPNQIVFEENTVGDAFYIIAKGSVEISKYTINDKRQPLSTLEIGDFFGEIALLHASPRNARVTAREACAFLVLSRQSFTLVFEQLPQSTRDLILATAEKRSH